MVESLARSMTDQRHDYVDWSGVPRVSFHNLPRSVIVASSRVARSAGGILVPLMNAVRIEWNAEDRCGATLSDGRWFPVWYGNDRKYHYYDPEMDSHYENEKCVAMLERAEPCLSVASALKIAVSSLY